MKTTGMIIKEYGENAKFEKSEINLPPINENQILVEVKATSLNPVDNKILRGVPLGPELPGTLHGDIAGVVTEIGSKVTQFKVNDEVYGIAGGLVGYHGASANHMIVNSDLISHKPKSLSFEEAAALPLVFITAYEGLVEKAKIQPNQNLLVIGGTGGVGHQAVQLARELGANVTAIVSSGDKAEIAKKLGANKAINRKEVSIDQYCKTAGVENGFDIIFDTVGGANLDSNWDLLKPNGQVITTTSMEEHDLTPLHMKGASLHVVFMLLPILTNSDQTRHQNILKNLTTLVEDKKITPLIENKTFNLDEINEAHHYFEGGKHLGKIIISNKEGLRI